MDADLQAILEQAFRSGATECQWVYDEWLYKYNMSTFMQLSVTTGAEREIRRVPRQEAIPGGDDEDWV